MTYRFLRPSWSASDQLTICALKGPNLPYQAQSMRREEEAVGSPTLVTGAAGTVGHGVCESLRASGA